MKKKYKLYVGQHLGTKKIQEDGFFKGSCYNFYIYGIIDGHTGEHMMLNIKRDFISLFKQYTLKLYKTINQRKLEITDYIQNNFKRIIKNFYIYIDNYYFKKNVTGGCCITVLFIHTKKIIYNIIQLGDTKIVLIQNKKKIFETTEHRICGDELKRIADLDGSIDVVNIKGIFRYKGLMISRVLGDYKMKNPLLRKEEDPLSCIPDVTIIENKKGPCVFIFLTDGITDILELEFVINTFKDIEGKDIKTLIESIISSCIVNSEYYIDNLSIGILVIS